MCVQVGSGLLKGVWVCNGLMRGFLINSMIIHLI